MTLEPSNNKEHRNCIALGLLAVFLFIYILPMGWSPLFSPDETRYAEIPREMIATGDWVVPHLDGVKYFEKPVLGYWVHAGSLLLFGENNFAVRLPSALSVGLAAWIVFLLASRASSGKGPEAALAALVFLTSGEVFAVGNQAVLDSLFALFLTATIASFWVATEAERGSLRERGFLALAGVACGMAFLTKGFLAFAVPGLALPAYLVWQRRFPDILRMAWIPALAVLAVSLPWALAIHHRDPDFWNYFFWNEHVRRFTGGDAQHSTPLWKFWLLALAMALPWLLLVPAAAPGVRHQILDPAVRGRLLRLAICWLVLPFLLVSFSRGKLITYILPCFPPFAILVSFGLSEWARRKRAASRFKWGAGAMTALFVLAVVAVVLGQHSGINGRPLYAESWKAILLGSALATGGLFSVFSLRARSRLKKLFLFGLAPVFPLFAVHFGIPDATLESKSLRPLLERNPVDPDTLLVSDATAVHAVCWQYKRADVAILAYSGELTYGMKREQEDGGERLLSVAEAPERFAENRGRIMFITRARRYQLLKKRLPDPVAVVRSGPNGYVVVRY